MADKTQNVKTRLSFDGEAEYKAACKEINSTLKVLNSEMKLVTAEYKDNASSVDALKAKQAVLQKTYDEQAKKVKETEAALEKCRKATGDNSEESKKLETQLNYQKAALVKTEQELGKTTDEMEKAEKAADEMGKEIKDSGEQADDAKGKFSGEQKQNFKKSNMLKYAVLSTISMIKERNYDLYLEIKQECTDKHKELNFDSLIDIMYCYRGELSHATKRAVYEEKQELVKPITLFISSVCFSVCGNIKVYCDKFVSEDTRKRRVNDHIQELEKRLGLE